MMFNFHVSQPEFLRHKCIHNQNLPKFRSNLNGIKHDIIMKITRRTYYRCPRTIKSCLAIDNAGVCCLSITLWLLESHLKAHTSPLESLNNYITLHPQTLENFEVQLNSFIKIRGLNIEKSSCESLKYARAGNMYKAGVDALANAILDDPRFLAMIVASALNENLAKQTKTFIEVVKGNAEHLKQEMMKQSIIAQLLQSKAKA